MNVLHILYELKFSGAEIMYVDAAPIFQEKGCKLSVMATANELGEYAPYFEKAGYRIIHRPIPPLKNYLSRIRFYIAFYKWLKNETYDVIHIHNSGAVWGIALCAWLHNIKSVFTYHNVYPSHFYSYPYHLFLRWTAKYFFKCHYTTISDSVYNHELNFYHNKTTKIYNWYGNHRYFPASYEEKANARVDLGIENNSFVIISIGGCSHIKRHHDIIRAMPLILEKIPNCLYLHLGQGSTETEEIELAKYLKVDNNIRFCGNHADVRKFIIASDVYIMPSLFEGISLTTIEAMACLIPAILYDVPGLRDFNTDGYNSVMIPIDFKILAEKVIEIYNNPDNYLEMTLRAQSFINKNFDMRTNASLIFDLYK